MEHVLKTAAEKFEHGSVTAYEYPMPRAALNLARIAIHGRYPETGFTSNTTSDSIVYVLHGTGRATTKDGSSTALNEGDQLHITPNEPYYFEGNLEILYAASPQWTPEQAKLVD